ncbi:MAG TPA: helix-turn-helix domain-containing protein [Candidatus Binatia bacterium]|nr:helix-turn-helix domain-containing protein [Candidatus Binatia bacterium]
MGNTERVVAREVKAVTRKEVVLKAIEGRITWIQAATILGISDRQMRRLKTRYERLGFGGLHDHRSGKPRRKRTGSDHRAGAEAEA